ncbi:Ficolin-2 [Lamellibrachia satsuma]|nr:Ficolin-2 [Lamellibrachia satsuma]
MDDVVFVCLVHTGKVEELQQHMNTVDHTGCIAFKRGEEGNNGMSFLDAKRTREEDDSVHNARPVPQSVVRVLHATAMCREGACSLMVLVVVLQPMIAALQRTVAHRYDDSHVDALVAMMSRLQDTVERQHQHCLDSVNQQQEYLAKLENILLSVKEDVTNVQEMLRRRSVHNCNDLLRDGHNVSGVYEVYLAEAKQFVKVYCDMETDGGGWLVFQRRQDGSIDFYRDWASYKEGFGNVTGEFWLGNDYLHDVTSQARCTLRIDLEDFEGGTAYAVYSKFAVKSEVDKYRLSIGAYSGTAGDALRHHAGRAFSTKDRDNDDYSGHCAQQFKGAWWYGLCHDSNLNGQYLGGPYTSYADGVVWENWRTDQYSLKKVEMKLKP